MWKVKEMSKKMKNLVILGASRAGKSTIAREINKLYPNYHIIRGDSIRHAFQETLPQNEINKYDGKGMKEDFARFSAELFKSHAKHDEYYNYIFDSCDVSVENAVKFFAQDSTIVIFLAYPKLTPKEAFENYRKYEKATDWTVRRTDEQLLKFAEVWTQKSKTFEQDCKKYEVRFIDTSYNREEKLKNLIDELKEELKK